MSHQHAVKTKHEILEGFFPRLGCEILNHKLDFGSIKHKRTTVRVSINFPCKNNKHWIEKFKVSEDRSCEDLALCQMSLNVLKCLVTPGWSEVAEIHKLNTQVSNSAQILNVRYSTDSRRDVIQKP